MPSPVFQQPGLLPFQRPASELSNYALLFEGISLLASGAEADELFEYAMRGPLSIYECQSAYFFEPTNSNTWSLKQIFNGQSYQDLAHVESIEMLLSNDHSIVTSLNDGRITYSSTAGYSPEEGLQKGFRPLGSQALVSIPLIDKLRPRSVLAILIPPRDEFGSLDVSLLNLIQALLSFALYRESNRARVDDKKK